MEFIEIVPNPALAARQTNRRPRYSRPDPLLTATRRFTPRQIARRNKRSAFPLKKHSG